MKKLISFVLLASFVLIGCSNKKEEEVVDKNPVATIEFENLGVMKFELMVDQAPQSVYNFIALANEGYYDGLSMHRIIKDFVAQGGDPQGTGIGGPGYSIKGEFISNNVENRTGHELGAIAFARSQNPDSAGSQFYIVLSEYDENTRKFMDNDYAAFGHLIEGQDILEKINSEYATTSQDGKPEKDLTIKTVTVDTFDKEYPAPDKIK